MVDGERLGRFVQGLSQQGIGGVDEDGANVDAPVGNDTTVLTD